MPRSRKRLRSNRPLQRRPRLEPRWWLPDLPDLPAGGDSGSRLRGVDDPDRPLRRVIVTDTEGQLVVTIVEADLDRPMTCAVDRGVLIEAKADVLRDRQPRR